MKQTSILQTFKARTLKSQKHVEPFSKESLNDPPKPKKIQDQTLKPISVNILKVLTPSQAANTNSTLNEKRKSDCNIIIFKLIVRYRSFQRRGLQESESHY